MDPWALLGRAFGWGGVIAYHGVGNSPRSPVMHVSPGRLREQLSFLACNHHVLPLRELVQRWCARKTTAGYVSITFDDAYAGVLEHAYPLLREFDLPATVFVTSDHALKSGRYWWDVIEQQRAETSDGPWIDAPATVGLPPFAAADSASMVRLRNRVITHFAGRWPREFAESATTTWRSMDFGELTLLAEDERIDFGVHTISHPALPFLPYEEQVSEMRNNLILLRERLPRVLPIVAYPYGLYDTTTVRAATQAGMVAGLTMDGRATANRPNLMMVPRIGAGDAHSPRSLERRLNRALRPALILRNRGARPRLPVRKEPASDPIGQRWFGA